MRTKYTEEELRDAVKNSFSIADVCRKVGIKPLGGNYKTIHAKLKLFDIDSSHFTGQGWNVGDRFVVPRAAKSLEEILVEGSDYSTSKLAKRLIKEGIKKHICECCENTTWMDQAISLELHHIDGVNTNNQLENLQLLCPNCHSYTDNYRGKNIGIKVPEIIEVKEIEPKVFISRAKIKICPKCNSEFTGANIYCSDICYDSVRRSNIPSKEDLLEKFRELKSYIQVGKYYNVSDNAVRKWCKSYDIIK